MLAKLMASNEFIRKARLLKWPDGRYVMNFLESGGMLFCGLPVKQTWQDKMTSAEREAIYSIHTWEGPAKVMECCDGLMGRG